MALFSFSVSRSLFCWYPNLIQGDVYSIPRAFYIGNFTARGLKKSELDHLFRCQFFGSRFSEFENSMPLIFKMTNEIPSPSGNGCVGPLTVVNSGQKAQMC